MDDITRLSIEMAILGVSAPPPSSQPIFRIRDYRFVKISDQNESIVILIGYGVDSNKTRSSTYIVKFGKQKMEAITQSGRVYHLIGEPGDLRIMGMLPGMYPGATFEDVTQEIVGSPGDWIAELWNGFGDQHGGFADDNSTL